MRAQLRRRLERSERVRDFLRAHNTDGVGQGLGLAKLEELLERAKVLDDLARALSEFERTLEASRAGRREHAGARADLEAIGAAIGEQVKLLDGVVQYQFGDDAELMGA